jgi:hypothetical protein
LIYIKKEGKKTMKRILKGLALLTVLATTLCFGSLSSYAQQNDKESASGSGSYSVGTKQKRQFAFTAVKRQDGTVTGNAVIQNPAFSFRAQLDISCLRITAGARNPLTGELGNRADIGGTIRNSNDPGLPEGTRGFFTVFDIGEPGKDKDSISPVFFDSKVPVSACQNILTDPTAPSGLIQILIESGNIQVRSSIAP